MGAEAAERESSGSAGPSNRAAMDGGPRSVLRKTNTSGGTPDSKRRTSATAVVLPSDEQPHPASSTSAQYVSQSSVKSTTSKSARSTTLASVRGGRKAYRRKGLPAPRADVAAPQAANDRYPTAEELEQFARSMGIHPIIDVPFMWIAEAIYYAPLPAGWSLKSGDRGAVFYYNSTTAKSQAQHPLHAQYMQIFKSNQALFLATQAENAAAAAAAAASTDTKASGAGAPCSPHTVTAIAAYLGIDASRELHLLWLARHAVDVLSTLPPGWERFHDDRGLERFRRVQDGFVRKTHPSSVDLYRQIQDLRASDDTKLLWGRYMKPPGDMFMHPVFEGRSLVELWMQFMSPEGRTYYYDFVNKRKLHKDPRFFYEHAAASNIQRIVRGRGGRKRVRALKRTIAANRIQAVLRRLFAKREYRRRRLLRAHEAVAQCHHMAACMIQALFRSFSASEDKRLLLRINAQHTAALRLQAVARRRLSRALRQQLAAQRSRMLSAVAIQSVGRAFVVGRATALFKQLCSPAALRVQATFRMQLARAEAARMYQLREDEIRRADLECTAQITLAAAFRRHHARRCLHQLRGDAVGEMRRAATELIDTAVDVSRAAEAVLRAVTMAAAEEHLAEVRWVRSVVLGVAADAVDVHLAAREVVLSAVEGAMWVAEQRADEQRKKAHEETLAAEKAALSAAERARAALEEAERAAEEARARAAEEKLAEAAAMQLRRKAEEEAEAAQKAAEETMQLAASHKLQAEGLVEEYKAKAEAERLAALQAMAARVKAEEERLKAESAAEQAKLKAEFDKLEAQKASLEARVSAETERLVLERSLQEVRINSEKERVLAMRVLHDELALMPIRVAAAAAVAAPPPAAAPPTASTSAPLLPVAAAAQPLATQPPPALPTPVAATPPALRVPEDPRLGEKATVIQCCVRGRLARSALLRQMQAASKITAAFKLFWCRSNIQAWMRAATRIQSTIKRYLSRQLRLQHRAARKIQSVFRMTLARKDRDLQRAALKIESASRMRLVRSHMARISLAANIIGARYKSHLCRRLRLWLALELQACVRVQAAIRCWLARLELNDQRRRLVGAVILQSIYRTTRSRRTLTAHRCTRAAAVVLQAAVRRKLCTMHRDRLRAHLRLQRIQAAASTMIQSVARMRSATLLRSKLAAAVALQFRRERACCAIACTYRMHDARCVRNLLALRLRSSLRIQAACRRHIARRAAYWLWRELHAALAIQCVWRTFAVRVDAALRLRDLRAATRIQCAARAFLAALHKKTLREAERQRVRSESALRIQRVYRGHQGRRRAYNRIPVRAARLQREGLRAASCILLVARCRLARKQVALLRVRRYQHMRHSAATAIQSVFRMCVVRRVVQPRYDLKIAAVHQRAATCLSAFWRMWVVRQHAAILFMERSLYRKVAHRWMRPNNSAIYSDHRDPIGWDGRPRRRNNPRSALRDDDSDAALTRRSRSSSPYRSSLTTLAATVPSAGRNRWEPGSPYRVPPVLCEWPRQDMRPRSPTSVEMRVHTIYPTLPSSKLPAPSAPLPLSPDSRAEYDTATHRSRRTNVDVSVESPHSSPSPPPLPDVARPRLSPRSPSNAHNANQNARAPNSLRTVLGALSEPDAYVSQTRSEPSLLTTAAAPQLLSSTSPDPVQSVSSAEAQDARQYANYSNSSALPRALPGVARNLPHTHAQAVIGRPGPHHRYNAYAAQGYRNDAGTLTFPLVHQHHPARTVPAGAASVNGASKAQHQQQRRVTELTDWAEWKAQMLREIRRERSTLL